jgi:hypothetical protein
MRLTPDQQVGMWRWFCRSWAVLSIVYGTTWPRRLFFVVGLWIGALRVMGAWNEVVSRRVLASAWRTLRADVQHRVTGVRTKSRSA